jgi:hypothetical protein
MTNINVRENRRGNYKWKIQSNRQQQVNKTQDENKRYRKPKGQLKQENPA